MKVAVVAPTGMPARRANTIQVAKMAQALCSLGQEVRLAVPGVASGEETDWKEWSRHYGLRYRFPVEYLPARPFMRRYDYGYHSIQWARQWRADLIYTRLPQAAALSSLTGASTILEVHDFPRGMAGFLFQLFLVGKGARRLVVITNSLASDLAARFGPLKSPPFTVIASDGVDLERYQDLPAPEVARRILVERGVSLENRFTAGYSGHLYKGRGLEIIMELASRLPGTNFLVVGGEPSQVAQFQTEVQSLGLKNMYLIGFVPNADLPLYQASCEVLLMPYQVHVASSSGGDIARYLSPMKLFEYMACGRAILSSDLPVFGEVLTQENALLLPPGEVDAWVKALLDLQNKPEARLALAETARRDANRYSWEARTARIFEI